MSSFKTNEKTKQSYENFVASAQCWVARAGGKNNEHQSSPQKAQKISKDQRSTDEKRRQRLQWTVLFVEHSASLCCKEAFVPLTPCLSHERRMTKEKQRKQSSSRYRLIHMFLTLPPSGSRQLHMCRMKKTAACFKRFPIMILYT